jgi:hypothetical protein
VGFVVGKNRWQTLAKRIVALVVLFVIVGSWGGVGDVAHAGLFGRSRTAETRQTTIKTKGKITEASPPIALQELRQALDDYQPQVTILSPRKNETLADNTVSVRFLVKDLPLFKDATFGLGPHLHVLLDNHQYQAVYDTSQPLVFNDLEPGTHTIRAFASRPWHESFKNEGAYVQTTFHVLTKTQDNSPQPELPLLTYSRPQGTYGAEPILLDFYLTNVPLHLVAQADETDDIADWRIRCTVNGESFIIDRWQPLYLKGFKPGRNWVQLEYLDEKGTPVQNVFNNTVRIVDYQPGGDDTLSKLVRGDLSAADVRSIVDPNYVPPAPILTVEPSPEPLLESSPEPSPESPPEASPNTFEAPQSEPSPSLDSPDRPSPIAPPLPEPSSKPSPEPSPEVILPTLEPSALQPSPTRSEPVEETDDTETPTFIAPPAASAKTERQPANPKNGSMATETQKLEEDTVSGQERLRQLQQRLGQYLSSKPAIAPDASDSPNSDGDRAQPMTPQEPAQSPSETIPTLLPPTPPEIIDGSPDLPSFNEPASSSLDAPTAP